MSQPEHFEIVILGSGQGGKLLAWNMARSGRRTAVVERRWIGGLANLPYPVLRDAVISHLTIAEGLGPLLANVPSPTAR
jgi:choline dehydrogenase-like flavoprotein